MFTRKKLLGGLIGLFAAGALLAPVAAAPAPANLTVTGNSTSAESVITGASVCNIIVTVSWDPSDLNGPAVNLQLQESDDGGLTWTSAGSLTRTPNDGSQDLPRYGVGAGSYLYQAVLTKGPKRVIASGASAAVVCAP